MPGLELVRKGSKTSDGFGKDVTHLLYLELPIYALYRHQLPDNKGELFGGLGPYFGYGLAGNFKFTFNGETTKVPAFDTKNGGFKRFDAGLALTAGYQFPGSFRVRLAYEIGLVNNDYRGVDGSGIVEHLHVFRIHPHAAIGCLKTDAGRFIGSVDQITGFA